VVIRVILNQDHVYPTPSDEIQRLIDNKFEIKILPGPQRTRNNAQQFAVFDSTMIVSGSYNWTKMADDLNYENALFAYDPKLVAGYQKYWDWMWGVAHDLGQGPISPASVKLNGVPPADEKLFGGVQREGFSLPMPFPLRAGLNSQFSRPSHFRPILLMSRCSVSRRTKL